MLTGERGGGRRGKGEGLGVCMLGRREGRKERPSGYASEAINMQMREERGMSASLLGGGTSGWDLRVMTRPRA